MRNLNATELQAVAGGAGLVDGGNKVIDGAGHAIHGAATWLWDTITGDSKGAAAAAKEFNGGVSEAANGAHEIHDSVFGNNTNANPKTPSTNGNNSGSDF